MKTLNVATVSENMTPKERAKLVISLQLKGLDIVGYTGETLPTDADIRKAVSGCPSYQAAEYNYYINLKQYAWTILMPIIEVQQSCLEVLEGGIAALRYSLTIAPLIHDVIKILKKLPAIVKRSEYGVAVEKARKQTRAEILELQGRYNLAEEEAYAKLVCEKKIPIDIDCLDSWLDYIEMYGKTQEELQKEAIDQELASIKHGLSARQKEKQRTGQILKALGFNKIRMTGGGRGIYYDPNLIRQLADQYGISDNSDESDTVQDIGMDKEVDNVENQKEDNDIHIQQTSSLSSLPSEELDT